MTLSTLTNNYEESNNLDKNLSIYTIEFSLVYDRNITW